MSNTPLSLTQENVERSIYERIRLELVDKGYTPDITLFGGNTGLDQQGWEAALTAIRTSQGFAIELFGPGSYEKNDDKKVPRIVIDAGFFSEGTLGGDQTTVFQLADDLLTYEAYVRPPMSSTLELNIYLVANTVKQLRVLQAILGLALQVRGYLPYYTLNPNEIQHHGNFFYRRVGTADLPQTEEGVLEKVSRYVVDDVYESEALELPNAPLITEIILDVQPGDPLVISMAPSCAPVDFYINSTFIQLINSGATKNLQVKDTNGLQTGSLIGDEWIVPAPDTYDIIINGVSFLIDQMGDAIIPVKSTININVGSKIGSEWIIGNSIVRLRDSNLDIFAGVPVPAEGDVTHDVGDSVVQILDSATTVLYTKTVKAQGNANQIITDSHVALKDNLGNTLQTVDVKAQATINKNISDFVTKKVYYNRPFIQNVPSYVNFDEGHMFTNGYDPEFHPTDGVLQRIDASISQDYLKYFNAFGHKFRFTGLLGGYYDFNDGTYRDVNGNISSYQAEFRTPVGAVTVNDGYIIDHLTGLGRRAIRGGAQTWALAISDVQSSTILTFSDWRVPTILYARTIERSDVASYRASTARQPFFWDQPASWTCTTQPGATTNAMGLNDSGSTTTGSKAGTSNRDWVRLHYARTDYVLQP